MCECWHFVILNTKCVNADISPFLVYVIFVSFLYLLLALYVFSICVMDSNQHSDVNFGAVVLCT